MTKELIVKIAMKLATHGVDMSNYNKMQNISILSNCVSGNKLISIYCMNESAVIEQLQNIPILINNKLKSNK
jgi:hypothetical protein